MRATLPALVRVLPRSAVPAAARVLPAGQKILPKKQQATLIDHLLERKKASPDTFPPNLRVEQLPPAHEWEKLSHANPASAPPTSPRWAERWRTR
ncbi:hypothetical protein EXIGLDRAFT_776935 [Exidia glandulosa HHB12029]|uniref:Uncharacterized protein n=1 Tax=Exidia glandulosa HHB12029 TaxID=1314781 RepID=A0A165D9P6_EXIGL|nr:hypothetical protein EXIGLDRAFT_776935 [Exidia glandulosa HHB12029]